MKSSFFAPVQVFLGETQDTAYLAEMQRLGWGRIWTTERPVKPLPGEPWAFDNGAYSCFLKSLPFDEHTFLKRLDRTHPRLDPPTFGVVPDIVGGGLQSLEFSLGWRPRLPDEWPWYLAVQDGMGLDDVSQVLDGFDGVFLGGTTRFKSEAHGWRQLAFAHSKPFHYGRASVLSRVRHAKLIGADSLDSSFPLWERARMRQFIDFVTGPPRQGEISSGPGALAPLGAVQPKRSFGRLLLSARSDGPVAGPTEEGTNG